MRAVVTRVANAHVCVDGAVVGSIDGGLLALVGVAADDTDADATYLARKTVALRIFADPDGAMNLALTEAPGSLLVVSQFTLLGDVRKGRRPSFAAAAGGDLANRLYERFISEARSLGVRGRDRPVRRHDGGRFDQRRPGDDPARQQTDLLTKKPGGRKA